MRKLISYTLLVCILVIAVFCALNGRDGLLEDDSFKAWVNLACVFFNGITFGTLISWLIREGDV